MVEVRRYDIVTKHSGHLGIKSTQHIGRTKNGNYIHRYDYETLEARCRELEDDLKIAQSSTDAAIEDYNDQKARAQKLTEALDKISQWPDGGNSYGQENIKRFAREALSLTILEDWQTIETAPKDAEPCRSCDGSGVDLYDGTPHDCQVCCGRGVTHPLDASVIRARKETGE